MLRVTSTFNASLWCTLAEKSKINIKGMVMLWNQQTVALTFEVTEGIVGLVLYGVLKAWSESIIATLPRFRF